MGKKDNRIKYNLLSGFVYQIVLIVLSFLLPRLYLENFGSEVNGVLSTMLPKMIKARQVPFSLQLIFFISKRVLFIRLSCF